MVAQVSGAYNSGLLTSPLWGLLAERVKTYRTLFLGSFFLASVGFEGMHSFIQLPFWLVCAFAIGAGAGGAATLSAFFVVDFSAQSEWEARLGRLQSFNAIGQVIGLMSAAAFSDVDTELELRICVVLLLMAMAVGVIGLPSSRSPGTTVAPAPRAHLHLNIRALAIHPKLNMASDLSLHVHHLNLPGLRALPQVIGTSFGRFLLSWFLLAFAVAGLFSYLPLMMTTSYNISPRATALGYGMTSVIGIGTYVLSGRLATRYGARLIYRSGLLLRMVGFGILMAPVGASPGESGRLLGLTGFAAIVIAWPFLSVSGTDLGARLAPFSEGAALGLLNATVALATAAGILFCGPLVNHWGYKAIPAVALAGLAAAFLLAQGDQHLSITNTKV